MFTKSVNCFQMATPEGLSVNDRGPHVEYPTPKPDYDRGVVGLATIFAMLYFIQGISEPRKV